MMERTESELKLAPAEQFRDVVSPPIFLLLTVVAANGIEVAVVGNNPLIDDGIGLATMITDNTSLILFRLIAFAALPVISAVFALAVMRRPVDRDTLQPIFLRPMLRDHAGGAAVQHGGYTDPPPEPAANIPAGLALHCCLGLLHGRRSGLVCLRKPKAGHWRVCCGHSPPSRCACWRWERQCCCSPDFSEPFLLLGRDVERGPSEQRRRAEEHQCEDAGPRKFDAVTD